MEKISDFKVAIKKLSSVTNEISVSVEQTTEAARKIVLALQKIPKEEMIANIKHNPSLSIWQKFKLIRKLK